MCSNFFNFRSVYIYIFFQILVTSKMSLSPLVTLTDIGGGGVVVTEGQVANQVVVMQGEKVVLFNIEENSIEKTWYGCTGRKIMSAVSALGMFGEVKVIMVLDSRTIVWGDEENKVESCDKLELDKDIRELVVLDKQHWVVFDDGSVEQLEYFKNNDREEWVIYPPVVKGEVILQTRLVQTSTHTVVSHLVEDTYTDNLVVVKGHIVLDSETQTHSVIVVDRIIVCLASEVVCHDLANDLTVALIKTNGSLFVFNTNTGMEEEVMKVPSTNHIALTHTTAGQVAVMGALSEGGFLQLVSTKYRAVVAETKLQNISHNGKGIFLVSGRLYMSVSSRVMSVQLGTHLTGGLDMLHRNSYDELNQDEKSEEARMLKPTNAQLMLQKATEKENVNVVLRKGMFGEFTTTTVRDEFSFIGKPADGPKSESPKPIDQSKKVGYTKAMKQTGQIRKLEIASTEPPDDDDDISPNVFAESEQNVKRCRTPADLKAISLADRSMVNNCILIVQGGEVVSTNLAVLYSGWPEIADLLDDNMCRCETTVLVVPWVKKKTVEMMLDLLYQGFCVLINQEEVAQVKEFLKELKVKIDVTEDVSSVGRPSEDVTSGSEGETFITPCYEDDEDDSSSLVNDNFPKNRNFQNQVMASLFPKGFGKLEVNLKDNCNLGCTNKCDEVVKSWSEQKVSMLKFKATKDVDTKTNLINHLKSQDCVGISTDKYQVNGHKFCLKYFAYVTGISSHLVKTVLHDFWRGQRMYQHGNTGIIKQCVGTTQFITWMKDFAEWYGQYSPVQNKIIINYWLRKGVLYKLYIEETHGPHIAQSTFYQYFEIYFGPNRKDRSLPCVRISKYSSHSVCNVCTSLNNHRRQSKSDAEMKVAQDLINQHKQVFGGAFRKIQEVKQSALSRPSDHLLVQVDGMDNHKSYLPRYLQNVKELQGSERLPSKISGCILWSGLYEAK